MDIIQKAVKFEGNTENPPEIKDLETPFQFFSYFFDEELFKLHVDESNKYAFQKKRYINSSFTNFFLNVITEKAG